MPLNSGSRPRPRQGQRARAVHNTPDMVLTSGQHLGYNGGMRLTRTNGHGTHGVEKVPTTGQGTTALPRPRPRVHPRARRPPKNNERLQLIAPTATLGAIARGTGLNVEHVSRIFNRKRTPSLRSAVKIAKFLQIPVEKLHEALSA